MNQAEAKQILLLYRPGSTEVADPQMAEALELARRDPELERWFKAHREFQAAMQARFRQIEVPAQLKAKLLDQLSQSQTIIRPVAWWQQPAWLAAAAAIVLLIVLASSWLKTPVPDRFANYESRMVGAALREYQMDIETNNMQAVRQSLAARGAPSDYSLPQGLEHLKLTGGGALRWRNNPVSMVCFDRGDKQMLFLFVMQRSAVKDPPPETPQAGTVRGLFKASWSRGDKTYLLAGPEEPDFLRKYL